MKNKPNSIEDIIKISKVTEDQLSLISYNGTDSKLLGAKNFMLAEMISEVYNEGKTENHWWGYYEKGSGFFRSYFDCWSDGSFVSSRLKFNKKEDFLDAIKKFPEIYKILMDKI